MKISLITVCFNAAEHITTALQTVSAQRQVVLEHLGLDGESTDTRPSLAACLKRCSPLTSA